MLTEKQKAVRKLRGQNDTLKQELKTLSSKLEEFVNASRVRRQEQMGIQQKKIDNWVDPVLQKKERELKDS